MTNIGWECPKCHRCYAPSITQCLFCGGNYQYNGAPIFPTYPPYINCGSGSTTTISDGKTYITYNYTNGA